MNSVWTYLDQLLFVALPYVALFTFFLVTIQRYRMRGFSYSSLSSQFLENQQHFWGLVPFHYGILVVLAGHIIGFLIPREVLAWNSKPLRLYVLEVTALIFGLLTLVGLVACVARRISISKVKQVTSRADWILFALLLVQVGSGVEIALFHPWGSSWFASSAVPYLWSIAGLNPNVAYITPAGRHSRRRRHRPCADGSGSPRDQERRRADRKGGWYGSEARVPCHRCSRDRQEDAQGRPR